MTKRAALAALVIAAAPACRACADEPQPKPDTAAPSPAPSGSDTRTDLVRHDCRGVEPEIAGCPETHGAGDALMHFSETLTELPARHRPPPASFWDAGRSALAAAKEIDVAKLRGGERVHVQNAALHLALAAAQGKQDDLARAAAALVRKLAFAVAERPSATEPPSQLEAWLGSSSSWIERSKTSPMFHETVFLQTRLVRIVRTPILHANFTQLLGVDVDGRPFLTSVVGSIEIRRGEENTSPACIATASPERVRCNVTAGVAAVRDVAALPKNHFFMDAAEGRLGCNRCHTAVAEDDGMLLGMTSIDAGGSAAELARRTALLVETVSRALAKL